MEQQGFEPPMEEPISTLGYKEIRPLQEADKENCLVAESDTTVCVVKKDFIEEAVSINEGRSSTVNPPYNVDFYGYRYLDSETGKAYLMVTQMQASSVPMTYNPGFGFARTAGAHEESQRRIEQAQLHGDRYLSLVGVVNFSDPSPGGTFNEFRYNPDTKKLHLPRPDYEDVYREIGAFAGATENAEIIQSVSNLIEAYKEGRNITAKLPLDVLGAIILDPQVALAHGVNVESSRTKLDSWVAANLESVRHYLTTIETGIPLGEPTYEKRLNVLIKSLTPKVDDKLLSALKESLGRVNGQKQE